MKTLTLFCLLLLAACTSATAPSILDEYEEVDAVSIMDAPPVARAPRSEMDEAIVAHGAYLVELLGCGACHTDGALIGAPDPQKGLAGSSIGIAYSNPLIERQPAVVYPANLTPDKETGLGYWSNEQIARAIRHGIGADDISQPPVMPWGAYQKLRDGDVQAIAAYLKSLAPVRHRVPTPVSRGQVATAPYVYFGVYQSREDM